ncbi:MAG TPA: TIGR03790 family protein, partial [Phycisphaerae bacterium]|nr:TIGR03790 family protein [Phycisphaerae bacterium]
MATMWFAIMRNEMFKLMTYFALPALLLGLAGLVRADGGLKASEVLVVANSADAESVVLAKYYAKVRNIPSKNIIFIRSSKGSEISREDYNSEIRDPLVRAIEDARLKATIRCICLIRGVPIRVAPSASLDKEIIQTYEIVDLDNLKLIARAITFASTVGVKFPQTPAKADKAELADFFEPQKRTPSPHPRDAERLTAEFAKQLKLAETRTRQLRGGNQTIAFAQLRALQMDLLGMEGLISLCKRLPHDGMCDIRDLSKRLDAARAQIAKMLPDAKDSSQLVSLLYLMKKPVGVVGVHAHIRSMIDALANDTTDASVDSELAMLWAGKYPLDKWQKNGMYWREPKPNSLLMTARLDGPSSAVVMRMIKDSLAVETTGLAGRAYIDAGGMARAKQYDKNFRELANFMAKESRLTVRLDREDAVFGPNSCPDASLYVGWYSRGKYV